MQSNFDQDPLSLAGFAGWEPLRELLTSADGVPTSSGIYVVIRSVAPVAFRSVSVGGHLKGKDPAVPKEVLRAKWLDRVATLYIGRGNNLRARLKLLARYGNGEPVAHQGGRYLWQLGDCERLMFGWRREDDPVLAEQQLLEEFEAAYGQLPFANLVRGTRPLLAA